MPPSYPSRRAGWPDINYRWLPVAILASLLPLIIYGGLNVESDTTDMRQWLPAGGVDKGQYDRFIQRFGPDDFVIVSWTDCTLTNSRLDRFADQLRSSMRAGARQGPLIRRVVTSSELVRRLTSESVGLERPIAIGRLRGTMVGVNEQACVLVEVTELGNQDPHAVIDLIKRTAKDQGLSEDALRLGGGIYEAVHIDDESQRSFKTYAGLSGVIALLVAWISLRSLRLTLIVVITGGYCAGLSVALIYFCGMRFNALMLVLPTLVYVLAISGAIHLVNYYIDAVRDGGPEGAGGRALAVGWLPCTLASVTTAIGMTSLAASQIQHVRSFGIYSAASLIMSLVVLLAFVPFALGIRSGASRSAKDPSAGANSRRYRLIDRFAAFVVRYASMISIITLAVLIVCGWGLSKTTSSVKIERMFPDDDALIRNYHWLETNMGPLAAMEVVVRFDPQCSLTMLQRLTLIEELSRQIETVPLVGKTFSAATLTPRPPRSRTLRATAIRAVFNTRLQSAKQQLVRDRVLAEEQGTEFWRITARIPALQELDYPSLMDSVQQAANAVLDNESRASSTVDIELTGTILVMNQAREQLLEDLVTTFAAAFALICPVMMLMLRSVVAGLASMIPNLVPAMVVFGGMGWLGIPIEIGTILTACVALGIAVDDTLHFLTWYRRSLRSGANGNEAIRIAYQRSAVAMIQTTLICGLGLLVFAASSFIPTSRFAILMFALMIAALFGDLILLPALLAGPCGRFFAKREPKISASDEAASS